MDDGTSADDAVNHVQAVVAKTMREHCPWLKSKALDDLLDETLHVFRRKINECNMETTDLGSRTSFLDLSAELRNKVCEYAIQPEELCIVRMEGVGRRCPKSRRVERSRAVPPPFARVCRQVRSEVLPIFCHNKTFIVYIKSYYYPRPLKQFVVRQGVSKWLKTIGPTAAGMVRCLTIEYSPCHWSCPHSRQVRVAGNRHWCRRYHLEQLEVDGTGIADNRVRVRVVDSTIPLDPGVQPAY